MNEYHSTGIDAGNRMIVYKLFLVDRNTWNHITVQTRDYRRIKVYFLKKAMEHTIDSHK